MSALIPFIIPKQADEAFVRAARTILSDPALRSLKPRMSLPYVDDGTVLRVTMTDPDDQNDSLYVEFFKFLPPPDGPPDVELAFMVHRGPRLLFDLRRLGKVPGRSAATFAEFARMAFAKPELRDLLSDWAREKRRNDRISAQRRARVAHSRDEEETTSRLFRSYSNGLGLASIVARLGEKRFERGTKSAFDILSEQASITMGELLRRLPGVQHAQLAAMLFNLSQLAWFELDGESDGNQLTITMTAVGRDASRLSEAYIPVADWIQTAQSDGNGASFANWRKNLVQDPSHPVAHAFLRLLSLAQAGWPQDSQEVPQDVKHQLDGALVGAILQGLSYDGHTRVDFFRLLQKREHSPLDELVRASGDPNAGTTWDPKILRATLDFLCHVKFIEPGPASIEPLYGLTVRGAWFAERAHAFGVPVSYFPTYALTSQFLYEHPLLPAPDLATGRENHVWRDVNVRGAGPSHMPYFRELVKPLADDFNFVFPKGVSLHSPLSQLGELLAQQPQAIMDAGCGNGDLGLLAACSVLHHSQRGYLQKRYPSNRSVAVVSIGVDVSPDARRITHANWLKAGVAEDNIVVLPGDIDFPSEIFDDLAGKGITRVITLSSALVHDRGIGPLDPSFLELASQWPADVRSVRNGVFALESDGRALSNAVVLEDLVRHLERWRPHLSFGYYLVELSVPERFDPVKNLLSYMINHLPYQYITPVSFMIAAVRVLGLNVRIIAFFPREPKLTAIAVYKMWGEAPQMPRQAAVAASDPAERIPRACVGLADHPGM